MQRRTKGEAIADLFRKSIQVGDCLLWQGATTKAGYGQIGYEGFIDYTHILAWEVYNFRRPTGHIDHTCSVPNCIARMHIEDVTPGENSRRTHQRGRGYYHYREISFCHKGHPFTEENTYLYRGFRHCKKCRKRRALINAI